MKKPKNKNTAMTQTAQPRSLAQLNDEGKELPVKKPEEDEKAELLLTLCDSLNDLYDKLCKLNQVIEKKIEEQKSNQTEKNNEN